MADRNDTERRVGRRDLLRYTGAGAAGVALAGCRSRSDEENGGGPSVGSGQLEGKNVKIGVLAPTPETYPVGTSMVDSAKMAADDINENGGIAGATVEVKVGNTEASPGTGREEYVRLVQEEGVDACFGTFLTQVTLQCFQPMTQFKVPLICTGAAGPKPTRVVNKKYDKYKYFFRVGPLNSFDLAKAELEFMNIYAQELGWKNVAVLIENIGPFDPFAKLLDENIRDIVENVSMFKRTSSGTTDWTPIWDSVENNGADLALISQALTGTASVKQWFNQKRQFEMGGIHVPSQVYEFWDSVGGACEYVFGMNAVTPQTTNTPRTQPWMKRYQNRFDTYPVYTGPITYDGIKVYAKAMANAVENSGEEKIPTADQLVPALEQVRFTKGVIIPEFQFTPKEAKFAHDPQWNSMKESGVPVWQQWQMDKSVKEDYGTMHSFAPEQNKTADYAFPHWIDYPSDHPANSN